MDQLESVATKSRREGEERDVTTRQWGDISGVGRGCESERICRRVGVKMG